MSPVKLLDAARNSEISVLAGRQVPRTSSERLKKMPTRLRRLTRAEGQVTEISPFGPMAGALGTPALGPSTKRNGENEAPPSRLRLKKTPPLPLLSRALPMR